MKKMILLLIFVIFASNVLSQVNQGDVLINTFDPRWNGANRAEVIVLVNNTNSTIDLNGYEVQSFGPAGETEKYGYCQFTSTYNIPPYSFLLISSVTGLINGVLRDVAWVELVGVDWPLNGYLALRKINPNSSADYIDIIKHQAFNPPFTGVPVNSGLLLTSPVLTPIGNTDVATRGGVSGDINSITYTGYLNYVSDFSIQAEPIIIQNSGAAPLPVELSSFSAVVLKIGIKLNWKTETEVNNYGFEIERKSNVKDQTSEVWEKLGFVNGSGNSNSPKNYSFGDRNLISGKYSYRLKQIDSDGKYEYSKAIEVNLNEPGKFELSQNYPNPFNPTTTIKFNIPEAGNVKLTLYNILAQEIKTLINESKEAGVHTVNFNASDLNSGLYIYKLEANGLTQTRKMTLVK